VLGVRVRHVDVLEIIGRGVGEILGSAYDPMGVRSATYERKYQALSIDEAIRFIDLSGMWGKERAKLWGNCRMKIGTL